MCPARLRAGWPGEAMVPEHLRLEHRGDTCVKQRLVGDCFGWSSLSAGHRRSPPSPGFVLRLASRRGCSVGIPVEDPSPPSAVPWLRAAEPGGAQGGSGGRGKVLGEAGRQGAAAKVSEGVRGNWREGVRVCEGVWGSTPES